MFQFIYSKYRWYTSIYPVQSVNDQNWTAIGEELGSRTRPVFAPMVWPLPQTHSDPRGIRPTAAPNGDVWYRHGSRPLWVLVKHYFYWWSNATWPKASITPGHTLLRCLRVNSAVYGSRWILDVCASVRSKGWKTIKQYTMQWWLVFWWSLGHTLTLN